MIELIHAKHYENETEYSDIYTTRKDGKYPLCTDDSVFWGGNGTPVSSFTIDGKPECETPEKELIVLFVFYRFAVYDANFKRVTNEYVFIEDLIGEIKDRNLKIFDFEIE